jgi:8-amino-7-oxononanoate synthase
MLQTKLVDYDPSNFYYATGDDPMDLLAPFAKWYSEAFSNGYYLFSEPLDTAPSVWIRVRDRKTGEAIELLNLASYNYLGISYRDEVKQAAIDALNHYGLGAAGSPILSGTLEIHQELANSIASFKGKEAALVFPSGYSANVGFISAMMRPGDHIILDQYAHASIVDGAILAKSNTVWFRHNSAVDLERKLAKVSGKKLVVVEGVYSMDGDICNLPDLLSVCKRSGARVLIDEAHSAFIYGNSGRGIVEHFNVEGDVDFHLGTFSKSLGGQGGYLCGTRELIDYVSAFARSRFFSCSLAPAIAAGLVAGIRIAQQEPELRRKLWQNVEYLRHRLDVANVNTGCSTSQVIPVFINDDEKVFRVAEKLQARRLFLQPVLYPAVPKNRSRLRISISAAHTEEDLRFAADVIVSVLREEEIIS